MVMRKKREKLRNVRFLTLENYTGNMYIDEIFDYEEMFYDKPFRYYN